MQLFKSLAERLSVSLFGKSDKIATEIVTYKDGSKINNRIVALRDYL